MCSRRSAAVASRALSKYMAVSSPSGSGRGEGGAGPPVRPRHLEPDRREDGLEALGRLLAIALVQAPEVDALVDERGDVAPEVLLEVLAVPGAVLLGALPVLGAFADEPPRHRLAVAE